MGRRRRRRRRRKRRNSDVCLAFLKLLSALKPVPVLAPECPDESSSPPDRASDEVRQTDSKLRRLHHRDLLVRHVMGQGFEPHH